jgi:hypothetical protein
MLIPDKSMEETELVVRSNRYFLDYETLSQITDNKQNISIWGIHGVYVKSIGVIPEDIPKTPADFTIEQIWRTSKYINVMYANEPEDNVRLSMYYDSGSVSDSTLTELNLYLLPDYETRETALSSDTHFVSFGIDILKERFPHIKKYNIEDSKGNVLFTFGT